MSWDEDKFNSLMSNEERLYILIVYSWRFVVGDKQIFLCVTFLLTIEW